MSNAVKNKEFWGLAKVNKPAGEAAQGINLRNECQKPIRIIGDLCKCHCCGKVLAYITTAHAESHGFKNLKEMIAAGQAHYV